MYGYCPSWALNWDYRKKVRNDRLFIFFFLYLFFFLQNICIVYIMYIYNNKFTGKRKMNVGGVFLLLYHSLLSLSSLLHLLLLLLRRDVFLFDVYFLIFRLVFVLFVLMGPRTRPSMRNFYLFIIIYNTERKRRTTQ